MLINAPEHVTAMSELDEEQFAAAVATWRERMRAHADASYVQLIVNEGGGAGASLEHSHAQLYALPFVPAAVARERERVGAYGERTAGGGLLSDVLVEEVRRHERLVAIDDEAALICPWASRSPFELRVVPRREAARFAEDEGGAAMIHTALRLLAERFDGSPELNLWVRTAPRGAEHFHWHVDIAPRPHDQGRLRARHGRRHQHLPARARRRRPARVPRDTACRRTRAPSRASSPTRPRRGSRTGASPSGSARPSAKACDGDRGPAGGRRAAATSSTGSPSAPGAAGSGFPARPAPRAPEGRLELFGHVSYVQPAAASPPTSRAEADFTDVLAEDNPDWKIDLNDDVIGRWRGENGRAGAVTLVWGRPLVRGAVAATAELDGETVDQEEISNGRFTLIALDALEGYGDDIFMQVKLWSRRAQELASESLYA